MVLYMVYLRDRNQNNRDQIGGRRVEVTYDHFGSLCIRHHARMHTVAYGSGSVIDVCELEGMEYLASSEA